MIDPAQRAHIRHLFFAEHWPFGTIAAELGVHYDTVARAVESQRFLSALPASTRSSAIDSYKEFIRETLKAHPRLRATRLFDMVHSRGYQGSVRQLRRFVQTVRPSRTEAFLRLRTLPAEQAQVDWGCFGKITVGRAKRNLCCFVMVLSYSRAIAARFFYNQTLESFLAGHVAAFESFGGVPRQLLYDNLKSVVLERIGDQVRYHPHILELAGHYHFAPKPCAPYRPNEKGKVERAIQYLRSSFFAAREFRDLEDLNEQLQSWINTVAHQRTVPTEDGQRTVALALAEERDRLLPLPQHPMPLATVCPVNVGKYPYFRFDKNDYSVPYEHVGKTLTVLASPEQLRVIEPQTGLQVALHLRCYDRGQCIEEPSHIRELVHQKRHARALTGRDRLQKSSAHAKDFIEAIAARGLPLVNQCNALLRLLDLYGLADFDAALKETLERQAHSASAVAYILDQRQRKRNQPPPLEIVLPMDERINNLHLTPHSLASYDELARMTEEK